ncbi:MAG: hydantoinase B/oxoprolinase family protein [Chloroflexi bacterium]|nr:hydantoinase B/oxoprolinase family protein [Chloroflexota bacterium]
MQNIDPITLDVWWNRFISIVDEMAAAVERTAFSNVVRGSNDYCCALLDAEGNLVAQNTRTIPSFIGTIACTVRHFLSVFPPESLSEDDVIITNDPWVSSGHLPDLSVALPIFFRERLVGFCGITLHLPDIGGRGASPDTKDFFEGGLFIPTVKLYSKGVIDQTVQSFITRNVRIPREVMGDIEAAITACKTGEARVIDFLREYALADLTLLATSVQAVSERAMREAIRKIPNGTFSDTVVFDGWDHPLTVQASVTIDNDEIEIDFAGTSPQVGFGINSVYNYTYAYAVYAIKCAICPFVPNNEGSCKPVKVLVPEGSVLNPKFPAPVSARYLSAHFIQAAVFGALAKVIPDRINADASAPFWGLIVHGQRETGEVYVAHGLTANGGQGASAQSDGISCLCIPSNVGSVQVEVIENSTGLFVGEKELVPDSAGPGQHRGGLAQRVTIGSASPFRTRAFLLTERIQHPARGLLGGRDGTPGAIFKNGVPIGEPKAEVTLNQGEYVTLLLPGGGGFGDARLRDPERIKSDLRNGYITLEGARRDYGFTPPVHEPGPK